MAYDWWKIKYVVGDATEPVVKITSSNRNGGTKLILHCCNDIGAWGAGFVLALSRKWKLPEIQYKRWHETGVNEEGDPFRLGEVQFVPVSGNIIVCNMIGQKGIRAGNTGKPPIRYDAIEKCLEKVSAKIDDFANKDYDLPMNDKLSPFTIHSPRFGCGLAGGTWEEIEIVIRRVFGNRDFNYTVYDLPPAEPPMFQ